MHFASAALLFTLAGSPGRQVSAGELDAAIQAACADVSHLWPVPPELVRAIIRVESDFNPRAVSKAGAIGLMQVMPFNAPKVGLTESDLWDAAKNVLAGTRLLAVLLAHYDGDLISALAAYNARPRKLLAPLPHNGETPAYVRAVLRRYDDYKKAEGRGQMGEPRSTLNRASDSRANANHAPQLSTVLSRP